jgi:hypothetical protein
MDSLTFTPGRAFLSSNSSVVPWTAVFEDEGPAGYFYACDRSQESHEHTPRLASIQWSRDGLQCVLYLDGSAQAFIDFAAHTSFCRTNFPNYIQEQGDTWRKSSHAWDDAILQQFEAAIYA